MVRSVLVSFLVVVGCFAILQVPGQPERVFLPTASGANYDILPLPGDCPGGVCFVQTTAPQVETAAVASVVSYSEQAPVYSVQYQPVVAVTSVRYMASRQPVRRVVSAPLRLFRSQPIRSGLRRIFCR